MTQIICITFRLLLLLFTGSTLALNIDNFNTKHGVFSAINVGGIEAVTTFNNDNTLGGELDLIIEIASGAAGNIYRGIVNGEFTMDRLDSLGNSSIGVATMIWDGVDNAPTILDATGLGGVDLTDNGTQDGFVFNMSANDKLTGFTVDIFSDTVNISRFSVVIPILATATDFVIPYSSFITQSGTGADFSQVGAIRVSMDSVLDSFPGPQDKIAIDNIATTSIIRASKTHSIIGTVSFGETINYSVVLDNAENIGNIAASDVIFTDTPDINTTLVVGSVTTSQGNITTGNNAGDTTVAIDVGDIASNNTVNITFDVVVNNPPANPISEIVNQGVINSDTVNNLLSDDPFDPTGLSDPTVIPLIQTEIEITGNDQTIVAGDTTPNLSDDTDFANIIQNSSTNHVFTINNTDVGELFLLGPITVTGIHAGDFSVTQVDSPISGGGSSVFTVIFTPTVQGLRTAIITVNSIDIDESSYTFTIQGNGVLASIGGSVTGLDEGNNLVIQNNNKDDLNINANSDFSFATELAGGSSYDVTVLTHPTKPNQNCTINNTIGTVIDTDINNIEVNCITSTYSINGIITGLTGNIIIQNNATDDINITADGSFSFAIPVTDEQNYDVTALQHPSSQHCVISNGSGQVHGANITNILIDCSNLILSLNNNLLDFNTVYIGESTIRTLVLSNPNAGAIVIDSFIFPSDPFSIVAGGCNTLPYTLAPSESCQLDIELRAHNVGEFTDTFSIISNAVSSPDSVQISATTEVRVIPSLNKFTIVGLILLMLLMVKRFIKPRFTNSKQILLIIMSFVSLSSIANVEKTEFDQLVACQIIIEDFNWSHRIWPEQNLTKKPPREQLISNEEIYAQTVEMFKMESALANLYGIKITNNMLQTDLNRMAENTKDPKRLEQLFLILDNNPDMISNCVSRPHMVKAQLYSKFSKDQFFHDEVKQLALFELAQYESNNASDLTADVYLSHYTIKDSSESLEDIKHSTSISLDKQEFENLYNKYTNKNTGIELEETDEHFVYRERANKINGGFKIKTMQWKKIRFDTWWKKESTNRKVPKKIKNVDNLQLPKISTTMHEFNNHTSVVKSLSNGPSVREHHTAIWTGVEMIVWGGNWQRDKRDTGGKYNPTTDSWTATSTSSVPVGRTKHSAVWTGTEMVIWGGEANLPNPPFNTFPQAGGRYNPVTNTWRSTTTLGAFPGRTSHTAVWSGSKMLIWGVTSSGGQYDPNNDTWSSITATNAPAARSGHSAVWIGSEMIVWGGFISDDVAGGRYNPSTDTWSNMSATNQPNRRALHTAVSTGNAMLVWGGYWTSPRGEVNTGGIYYPDTDSWSEISTLSAPSKRRLFTAVWTGTEMVVWGGFSVGTGLINTGGRYNLANNSWRATTTSAAPSARRNPSVVWTGTEMIVWGGYDGNFTSNGGQYNPSSDSWSAKLIGGSVSGLQPGNSLVVQNNGSSNYTILSNGTFSFPSTVEGGSNYNVTVLSQPTTPDQVCTVANGSGTVAGVNISNITITCTTQSFTVSGNVTGLVSSSQVVIQNNNADDIIVTASSNGNFTFPALIDGSTYDVRVKIQPTSPNQSCSVVNGSGQLSGSNITNVIINCIPNSYSIGGTVFGLALNNEVVLQNNSGDDLSINANGSFTFATAINDESTYDVTIITQPTTPNQTCNISNGTGIITGTNITNVSVVCTTSTYFVGGSISGLAPGNNVIIQNNVGDDLNITTDGLFTFATAINDESTYDVAVLAQPSTPNQTCVVTNESGIIAGTDISNISVTCTTNTYGISGTLSGLAAGNEVILQNNLGDDLAVNSDGLFTFATAINDGSTYDITLLAQPSTPNQTCVVTNNSGIIAGTNIINISVTCTTNTYGIGGTVSGLATGNEVILQNNLGDDLAVNSDGLFTFATAINDGSTYDITLLAQPSTPNQTCVVTNNSGIIAGTNIINISVTCTTNTYGIGGTVSGLATGNEVILQNNLGDDLAVNSDGLFTFATAINDGSTYDITLLAQPSTPNQTCVVTNDSGIIAGTNIINISVTCTTNTYGIGGTLLGLAVSNEVIIQNNLGDDLTVNTDGLFTFATELDDESNYDITVLTQPNTPNQTCVVTNESGTIAGTDIINISVTCTTNTYGIGGTVSGLATGNEVILQNNLGDDLTVNSDGLFTFATAINDESTYDITVLAQPSTPNQTCIATNESGMLAGTDISNISVTCTTNTYGISGTVSGLATGNEVILQNNLGDDLTVNTDGLFTFAIAINDESTYVVTVLAQPSTPNQTCVVTNDSGIIAGTDISNISVTCTTSTYGIGGTVSGLATGNEVILQNNLGDDLTVNTDGLFTFTTAINDESTYVVTVLAQPNTPNQTCIATNESGTIAGTDISNISVTCTTNTYGIGGTVSGLATGNEVILQNNLGDDLTVNTDGSFTFATELDDESNYDVTVLTQPNTPNQTCIITNRTGQIAGINVENISIYCNTEPTAIADSYITNEDILLIANNSSSIFGVLENDLDIDNDTLSIESPGTYSLAGIGGTITIEANGEFIYSPPTDIFGEATFNFNITDGMHTVASSLNINVKLVNDAPDFSIIGDIYHSRQLNPKNTIRDIPNFANQFVFGPSNESSQLVQAFNTVIVSDSSFILNHVDTATNGTLSLEFTENFNGIAIILIKMQDDGGVENGGMDLSLDHEFFVVSDDIIFANSFEELGSELLDFVELLVNSTSLESANYDYESDTIQFYNHIFYLNGDYSTRKLQILKLWLKEIQMLEDPMVDYNSIKF